MKQTQRDERGRERGEEEKEKEEEAKRERKGRDRDKEPNQRDVADILLKAKPTRSNLSTQQKKGLSYLKKNKDKIAIVPFDKGQDCDRSF